MHRKVLLHRQMVTVLAARSLLINIQLYSICCQQRRHNEKVMAYLVTSKEALGLQSLAGHAEKA